MKALILVEGKHCFVCWFLGFICQFEPEEMHQGSSHNLHLPVCKFLPQADVGARLLSWKKEDWLDANGCPKINEITDHCLRKLVNTCHLL